MLGCYLFGFSLDFMQSVLSFLTAYEVAMVAYTCRGGNQATEVFRRRVYQEFINRGLVPAPGYTVGNFCSRFCVCESCGEGPRISLYSWSFLPRVQRALSPYESWPPAFHRKCRACAMSAFYDWLDSGERVCIVNDCSVHYISGDEDEACEEYYSFMVVRWTPYRSEYCSTSRCLFCWASAREGDRVVGVLVNDEVYRIPDIYHLGCFFSRFAVWTDCGQMTVEEQTLPVFGAA